MRTNFFKPSVFMKVLHGYLGQTEQVKEHVVNRAESKHEKSRFQVFWGPNYSWVPDQDHGNVLLKTLQSMLMQADGKRICLLPAWPVEWGVDFKIHAPFETTIIGTVREGELVCLEVNPKERLKDIVINPSFRLENKHDNHQTLIVIMLFPSLFSSSILRTSLSL